MHRALSDYLAIPMAILSKSHLPISSSWPCSGLMDDLGCGSLRGQRPQFWSWEGQLCCPLVQSHQLPCQDWLPFFVWGRLSKTKHDGEFLRKIAWLQVAPMWLHMSSRCQRHHLQWRPMGESWSLNFEYVIAFQKLHAQFLIQILLPHKNRNK